MMTEEKWKQLEQVFRKEDNFNDEGWFDNDGEKRLPFDLMACLDCNSTRPSWDMMDEFRRHGYRVDPVERDSFGWLIGAVQDNRTGRRIAFG